MMTRRYDGAMPTTLNIEDDLLAVARAVAERNGSSLGSALSESARRRFNGMGVVEDDAGFPVFMVEAGAPAITSQDVCRALDDWP